MTKLELVGLALLFIFAAIILNGCTESKEWVDAVPPKGRPDYVWEDDLARCYFSDVYGGYDISCVKK